MIAKEAARLRNLDSNFLDAGPKTLVTDYIENFYSEGKSQYIQIKREHNPQALQSDHLRTQASYFNRYVKRFVGRLTLGQLTPTILLQIQGSIRSANRGLKPQTVNAIFRSLTHPIREAVKSWIIPKDPTTGIIQYAPVRKATGIFSLEEAQKLMGIQWTDVKAKAAFQLALVTGMRKGEILALRWEDLSQAGPDSEAKCYINLLHSWSKTHGLKSPKNGKTRMVPVPEEVVMALQSLWKGKRQPSGFIYCSQDQEAPISGRSFDTALKAALVTIGIPHVEQEKRGLRFHSSRHFFNSYMATKVDNNALRSVIGHSSPAMTEHYYHVTNAEFEAIQSQQTSLLSLLTPVVQEVSA